MTLGKKVAYFHNPGSESLRQLTVGDLLDRVVADWPDRTALVSVHEDLKLTYKEVKEKSNQLAAGLLELGLTRGDRLGIMGTNSAHWYLTALAAARIGVILVPINPALKEDEVSYCLKRVQMKAVVTDETFRNHRYYETLCTAVPHLKSILPDHRIESPDPGEVSFLIVHTDTKLSGAYRYKDVLKKGTNISKVNEAAKLVEPDDPFAILFSSGTTGLAKPTVITHFMISNNAYFCGKRMGFNKKHHTVCLQVQLHHIFGLGLGLVNALNHANTIIMPSSTFKAASTIEAIKKYSCSAIYGTPSMYLDLCELIREKVKTDFALKGISFDVALAGGAPCSSQLHDTIKNTLNCKDVQFCYGMSETSPVMVQHTENDTLDQRLNTVGMVSDHVEVKVVDRDGRMVPFGSPGEIWFRSYATMIGYWNDDQNTKNIITPARWIKSGDMFILYENGYGTVVGRIKDLIIRGGENIIPMEVENFIAAHPEVVEVQVYGVTDKKMGEEVAASVKLKPFSRVSEDILMHFCRGKIAHFKAPKYIVFVNDFPMTESGKVKKSVLRDMMERSLRSQFVID